MNRLLALFTAAVFLLAILAPAIPVALAEEQTIKTSRDAWGTIGNNTYFTVQVVPCTEDMALEAEAKGTTYEIFTYKEPGKRVCTTILHMWPNGTLMYYNKTESKWIEVVTLEPGDTITFRIPGTTKEVKLIYDHKKADFTPRAKIPYPVNETGAKDWVIVAPDLNKWYNGTDAFAAYIVIEDYTKGKEWNVTAVFKETGDNTAEFKPTKLENLALTTWSVDVTTTTTAVAHPVIYNDTGFQAFNATKLVIEVGLKVEYSFDLNANEYAVNVTVENVTQKLGTTVIDVINVGKVCINNVSDSLPTAGNSKTHSCGVEIKYGGLTLGILNLTVTITNVTTTTLKYELNVTGNITVDYEYLFAWAGITTEIEPGDDVDVTVYVPQYLGITTELKDTVTKSIEVFRYAGKIVEAKATTRELYVKVEDLSENKKSYEKEKLAGVVEVQNGSGVLIETIDLTETAEDTGVFEGKLSKPVLYYYPNYISAEKIGETNKLKIVYRDPSEPEHQDTKEIYVEFYKAELTVKPEKASLASTLEILIKDPDLNLNPDERDRAEDLAFSGNAGYDFAKDVAVYVEGQRKTVGRLMLMAELEDGSKVLMKAVGEKVLSFVETGADTGTFRVMVPLADFKPAVAGKKVEKLLVIYEDWLSPDGKVNVTAEVPIVSASIEVDRSEIPMTKVGSLKVHVKIIDPSMNTDPYAKDEIISGADGNANITWALTDVAKKNVTRYYVVPKAVETDVNTGEFEATIEIEPGNFTPDAIGGYLHVNYTSDKGTSAEVYVPLKVFGIELKVNETAKLAVKYGDVLSIVLVDPDANLDTEEKDKVSVTIVLPGGVEKTVTLEETDVNTGVFKNETVVIKGTMFGVEVKPTETIKLKYADEASPLTPKGAEEWVSSTAEVEVYVKSFTGELYVNGTTGKIEVGPKASLNITVVDWDRNKDPEAKETVDVVIKYWNGTTRAFKAEETGDSTGVFVNSSIKMSDLLTGTKLSEAIGKSIYVIYRDPVDAAGSITVRQVEVVVKAWTGEVKTDKNLYKPGETIKITVVDPDRAGEGSVSVRVYSTSDPVGTTLTLVEVEHGKFVGEIKISKEPTTERGYIYAKIGDTVTIEYTDKLSATGETATITKTVSVGVPPEMIKYPAKVSKEEIKLVSEKGAPVAKPKVGKWAFVSVPVKNVGVETLEAWVKVVVRDASGTVVHMAFQKIKVAPGEATEVMPGWKPEKPGAYTVEVYVIKSLAEPVPITEEPVYKVTVEVTE